MNDGRRANPRHQLMRDYVRDISKLSSLLARSARGARERRSLISLTSSSCGSLAVLSRSTCRRHRCRLRRARCSLPCALGAGLLRPRRAAGVLPREQLPQWCCCTCTPTADSLRSHADSRPNSRQSRRARRPRNSSVRARQARDALRGFRACQPARALTSHATLAND